MMTREDFDKLPFDRQYWDSHGGTPTNRPYWDGVRSPGGEMRQRVFVSATRYPVYADWHTEAQRALEAVNAEFDVWSGTWRRRAIPVALANSPHYLWDGAELLVNVVCPCEAEFNRACNDARLEMARQLVRLATQEVSHPYAWCLDEPVNSDVQRLLQSL